MKRVWFSGCAGWLHEAPGSTGVVLCAPLGHEAMWSHRAWRHLADEIAAAGMPVLRFDYPGTGDSAGSGLEPEFLRHAVSAIIEAAAQLRALSGVEELVLCGIRLGASLAVLAAEAMQAEAGGAGKVAGLVLAAPVVNGRSYLRELRALHLNWLNSAGLDPDAHRPGDGSIDVLAFHFAADTVHEIESLRLDRRAPCAVPRLLMLDAWPGSTSPVSTLAQRYRAAGAQAEIAAFDEYPVVMQSAEYASVPTQAWQQVVGWLVPGTTAAQRRWAGARQVASEPDAGEPVAVDAAVELAVWLDGGRQFGILSLPRAGTLAATAVIFPNTGGNHHVGDGRMFVTLSRRLAGLGVAALRLDVSALGDSAGAKRQMSIPAIYSPGPRADVSAAVDWMRARGFQRIVLAGVCSGAFLSLQAALVNRGVDGLVMANLVKFRWDRADDAMAGAHLRSWRGLLVAVFHPGNWVRLGRGELRVWPLLAGMSRLSRRRLAERVAFTMARLRGAEDLSSVASYAQAAMRELDRRGVRTDFLYGVADVGLEEARRRLGANLETLDNLPCIAVYQHACLDHALFLASSREAFCDLVVRHMETHLAAHVIAQEHAAGGAESHDGPSTVSPAMP